MRVYVTLECSKCSRRNYRTSTETGRGKRLALKKYCRFCRTHTIHNERRR